MIINYYETCCSQYHAGHHQPTVQASVDGNTTYADVQELLKDSFAYCHLEEREFRAESHYDAYSEAVDAWFSSVLVPLTTPWEASLGVPDDDDDEWDCYAYFVIAGVDEHLAEALKKHPNTCPYCGKGDLHSHQTTSEEGDNNLHQRVLCPHCKESWVERYELTEVTFSDR